MRTVSLPSLLLLAACGGDSETAVSADDGRIDCRIGTADRFERVCTIERSQSGQGLAITIRKPDGGFRRLLAADDGRGIVAADGAEPAIIAIAGDGRIDVAIGVDVFRLPATVRR